jgi:propionyl-CoA carboxylase beta chain
MTEAATSEKIGDDVGGADYHMIYSGTCDLVGENDRETLLLTRRLLGYLPANWRERPPSLAPADPRNRPVAAVLDIVPDDIQRTYNMHEVIRLLVDDGEFLEIKDEYAKNLITCFCRFNGEVVGLAASNPQEPGGILEINSSDKYYRFLQVLDAYSIPLVTLVDTPATVPGEDQEARGLLRHAAKILDAYATATIPKISVILREAYADAGSLVLGGAKGLGVDLCYAWPIAQMAVEASTADYRELPNLGIEADAYTGYLNRSREKVNVFEVARSWTAQVVDEIIEPRDTRKRIIEALELTRNKREGLPRRAKRHGTGPS